MLVKIFNQNKHRFCTTQSIHDLFEKNYLKLDYYSLLQASKDSSQDDIKKNYYKLVKSFHPDRYKGNPNIIKKISEAYKTLSNTQSREVYNKKQRIKIKINKKKSNESDETTKKHNQKQQEEHEKSEETSKYENDFNSLDKEKMKHKFFNKKISTDFSKIQIFKSDVDKKMNPSQILKKELFKNLDEIEFQKKNFFIPLINNIIEKYEISTGRRKTDEKEKLTYKNLLNLSGFTFNKTNKNTQSTNNNVLNKQNNNKTKLLFILLFLYLFTMAFYLRRRYLMNNYLSDKIKYDKIKKDITRISSLY